MARRMCSSRLMTCARCKKNKRLFFTSRLSVGCQSVRQKCAADVIQQCEVLRLGTETVQSGLRCCGMANLFGSNASAETEPVESQASLSSMSISQPRGLAVISSRREEPIGNQLGCLQSRKLARAAWQDERHKRLGNAKVHRYGGQRIELAVDGGGFLWSRAYLPLCTNVQRHSERMMQH